MSTVPPWLVTVGKLRAARFNNEAALQAGIEAVLVAAGATFEREHRLTETERIDFTVEHEGKRWGIECKTAGVQGVPVWRQLIRYLPHVDAIVLVTTKPVGAVLQLKREDGSAVPTHVLELWKNF